jgi:hypothetical protein
MARLFCCLKLCDVAQICLCAKTLEISRRREILPFAIHSECANLYGLRIMCNLFAGEQVSCSVETSRRREVLPFAIHREVAPLEPHASTIAIPEPYAPVSEFLHLPTTRPATLP